MSLSAEQGELGGAFHNLDSSDPSSRTAATPHPAPPCLEILPLTTSPPGQLDSSPAPRSRLTSPAGGWGAEVWFESRGNGALTARGIFREKSGPEPRICSLAASTVKRPASMVEKSQTGRALGSAGAPCGVQRRPAIPSVTPAPRLGPIIRSQSLDFIAA